MALHSPPPTEGANQDHNQKKTPHERATRINKIVDRFQLVVPFALTAVLSFALGVSIRSINSLDEIKVASPEHIVFLFFCSTAFFFVLGGLVLIAYFFLSASSEKIAHKDEDTEYKTYVHKCEILRVCYGFSVFSDIFLTLVEVLATAIGIFIVLIPGANTALVAVMLIASFLCSSIRNVLGLKFCRIAYAKAFRELEFAVDDYRVSPKESDDVARLHAANEKAQQHIAYFCE